MSVRTSQRRAVLAAPIVAAGLLLGACGGADAGGASVSTVSLGTSPDTNYLTIPPATTPSTTDPEVTDSTEPTGGVTEYTIQSGDYGNAIAKKFGISLKELEDANGWADASKELPYPGQVIKIPAGATQQGSTDTGGGTGTIASESGDTIPPSGDNCSAGKYTIAAGDIPIKVAEKFGVSLDRLRAANPSMDFDSTFPVGAEIVIPEKDGC